MFMMTRRTSLRAMFLLATLLILPAQADEAPAPLPRPALIYVAPFKLAPELVKEHGIGARLRNEDTVAKAQKLTQVLAQSIVEELHKGGQAAELAGEGAALAQNAWLVSGQFVKADAGRRLLASTIGLGAGATSVGISVEVHEVLPAPTEPLLSFDSTSSGIKRKLPGGLITKSPFVVGAKLVLSRNATESDVKKQGVGIAKNILSCMTKPEAASTSQP